MAVLLAAALLVAALPTSSAAGRSDVGYDDFPLVAQVARSYPYLEGGRREMFWNHREWVPQDPGDCAGEWTIAQPKPRHGRLMVYEPRPDSRPDPPRWPSVLVHGYWYPTAADARSALRQIRTSIGPCRGRLLKLDEGFVLRVLSDLPFRGQRFGYRIHATALDGPKSSGEQWYLQTFVRRGRAIASVSILRTTSAPAQAPVYRLTRAALRAIDPSRGD